MLTHDELRKAADAADEIAADFLRVDVRKQVDPLTVGGFVKISKDIARKLDGVAEPMQAQALRRALDTLDVDWEKLSPAQVDRIVLAARSNFARTGPKLGKAIAVELKPEAKDLVAGAKISATDKFKLGINPTFSKVDDRIVKAAWESQGNFVARQHGRQAATLGARARVIVSDMLDKGRGRFEIAKRLEKELGPFGRTRNYWEIVAASFTNRSRTFGQLSAFAQAGIQTYVWESVLDEVTTEQCRFMHGKTFPVGEALKTIERVDALDDPEDLKNVQPWLRVGRDEDGKKMLFTNPPNGKQTFIAGVKQSAVGQADKTGTFSRAAGVPQLLDAGVSMPPIHGLCRSTLLPGDPIMGPSLAPPKLAPSLAPKAPRVAPGVPVARQPKGRGKAKIEEGKHFQRFEAGALKANEQADMLDVIDDLGIDGLLEAEPIGNLMFPDKRARKGLVGAATPNLPRGVWGTHRRAPFRANGERLDLSDGRNRPIVKVWSGRVQKKEFGKDYTVDGDPLWSVGDSAKSKAEFTKHTLVHEIGHYVHFAKWRGFDPVAGKEFFEIDSIVKKAFVSRETGAKRVSRYAMHNHKEFFAESFAAHFFHPDVLRARDPVAFQMVEDVRAKLGLKSVRRGGKPRAPKPKKKPRAPRKSKLDVERDEMLAAEILDRKPVGVGVNGAEVVTAKTKEGKKFKAIYKSIDGEAAGLREGIRAGTYHKREAAFFEFDKMLGGNTVTPTTISAKLPGARGPDKVVPGFRHPSGVTTTVPGGPPEVGSYQRFVPGAQTMGARSKRADALRADFDPLSPEARRVNLLDMISGNSDRHSGNVMLRRVKGRVEPVAIDNGLTFPVRRRDRDAPGPERFIQFGTEVETFSNDRVREVGEALLRLNKTEHDLVKKLDLADVAALLKRNGIEEDATRAALVRIRAMQKNPNIVAETNTRFPIGFGSDSEERALGFMDRSYTESGAIGRLGLTQKEYDSISKLAVP